MFCIIAFAVLAILGIFSAANRALAKEAFDCVLRRVTLRPCTTGFDEKMKAKILGSVITRSETAARFLNKNFEILSWSFFILFLISSIWSVRGLYLFYVTGSCNGLNEAGFCVFDPKGENNEVSTTSQSCNVNQFLPGGGLTLQGVKLDGFPVLNPAASDKIVFIGCYSCDYTRKAYPMIRALVKKFPVSFIFLHYPVKEKSDLSHNLGACIYQQDPEKYWQWNDALFAAPKDSANDPAFVSKTLAGLGLDQVKVDACVNDPQTAEITKSQKAEIEKTNFFGTPTIFINGVTFVGPKPYRVYAIELRGLFYWLR
jgi:protein-disulfide isomerase